MIPIVPWYVTLTVLVVNLTVAITVWNVLSAAAKRSGLAPTAVRRARIGIAVFLGLWLGGALLTAPAPESLLTRDPYFITPLIPAFVIVPLAIVLVALWRSVTVGRILVAAPLPSLIAVQAYRAIGVVFLVLLAGGQVPAHFALPAGWGDIAIGLSAPVVALALVRRRRWARSLAVSWNVLGLLDLAVAVGMGTGVLAPLLVPDLGPRVPAAGAMGVFPMFLVPAFTVPISVFLHLLALARLRRVRSVVSPAHASPEEAPARSQ